MLNDVAGIKISGANFIDETELMFFSGGKKKISSNLLFGRNGSGKSTIAQGIRNIKYNSYKDNVSCYFIDENSEEINLDEYDFKNIHIFDEKFIDQNIKLAEDGLDTILLIGENVNTDIKLKEENSRKDEIEDKLKEINLEVENYLDKKNIKSHLYSENKFFNTLKKPGNWAQKDGYFRGNKQNSAVNPKKCKELYSLSPDKSEEDLIKELNDKEKNFTKYNNNHLSKVREVVVDENLKFDDERIKILVESHIEQPILSDREKILLSLGNNRINQINNHFKESDVCPYCLQELSKDYKEGLFRSIEKILSESAEKFYQTLKCEKVTKIELNLKSYETVNLKQVNICEEKLRDFNKEVDRVNSLIDNKLDHIYIDIKVDSVNLNSLYIEYLNSIKILNGLIKDHNNNIEDINKLKDELIEINNFLGHYQIKEDYKDYLNKLIKYENLRENKNKLKEELSDIIKSIEQLESEKYNYSQAINYINKGLYYIFLLTIN